MAVLQTNVTDKKRTRWIVLLSDMVDLTKTGTPDENVKPVKEKIQELSKVSPLNFVGVDASFINQWNPQHKNWPTWCATPTRL